MQGTLPPMSQKEQLALQLKQASTNYAILCQESGHHITRIFRMNRECWRRRLTCVATIRAMAWPHCEISHTNTPWLCDTSGWSHTLSLSLNAQCHMQGRPPIFVDMRIVDDNGKVLPHDGKAYGDLQVRGPHVISRYYRVCSCSMHAPILSGPSAAGQC